MAVRLINRNGRCAFPLGEPCADMRVCGEPVTVGSYCGCHAALCYVKPPEKLEPAIGSERRIASSRPRSAALMDARGWGQ